MTNIKHIIGFALFLFVLIPTIYIFKAINAPEEHISPVPTSISYPQPSVDNEDLSYKIESVVLDTSAFGTFTRLKLNWSSSKPAPEKIWIYTYFFTEESSGRFRFGNEPVEINRPFANGNTTASIVAKASSRWYQKTYGNNFYANVNISVVSSEDARLKFDEMTFDIRRASPVLIAAN